MTFEIAVVWNGNRGGKLAFLRIERTNKYTCTTRVVCKQRECFHVNPAVLKSAGSGPSLVAAHAVHVAYLVPYST